VLQSLLPLIRDVRRSGCPSLDICAVASGKLDGFYESNLGRWDIAAAAAIAEAAGAKVDVIESATLPSPVVVVANPELCGKLVDALRSCEELESLRH
jgi:myo-inositol-1(or 4)-monophosphatase